MILMIQMNLMIVKRSFQQKVIHSIKIPNSMINNNLCYLTTALNLKIFYQTLVHTTSPTDNSHYLSRGKNEIVLILTIPFITH